jgi:hypothetical protein
MREFFGREFFGFSIPTQIVLFNQASYLILASRIAAGITPTDLAAKSRLIIHGLLNEPV